MAYNFVPSSASLQNKITYQYEGQSRTKSYSYTVRPDITADQASQLGPLINACQEITSLARTNVNTIDDVQED